MEQLQNLQEQPLPISSISQRNRTRRIFDSGVFSQDPRSFVPQTSPFVAFQTPFSIEYAFKDETLTNFAYRVLSGRRLIKPAQEDAVKDGPRAQRATVVRMKSLSRILAANARFVRIQRRRLGFLERQILHGTGSGSRDKTCHVKTPPGFESRAQKGVSSFFPSFALPWPLASSSLEPSTFAE